VGEAGGGSGGGCLEQGGAGGDAVFGGVAADCGTVATGAGGYGISEAVGGGL